jgi:hypothetical protein
VVWIKKCFFKEELLERLGFPNMPKPECLTEGKYNDSPDILIVYYGSIDKDKFDEYALILFNYLNDDLKRNVFQDTGIKVDSSISNSSLKLYYETIYDRPKPIKTGHSKDSYEYYYRSVDKNIKINDGENIVVSNIIILDYIPSSFSSDSNLSIRLNKDMEAYLYYLLYDI